MKEFEIFIRSLTDSIKSLGKVAEAMAEKLEKSVVVKTDVSQNTARRKPVGETTAKKAPKAAARRKTVKPEEGNTIVAMVQAAIESNPGIDFKSLREKTGFEDKQLRNTVARLKKQGKITAEGRGVYRPAS